MSADAFASSPSGYVITALIGVLVLVVGFMGRSVIVTQGEQGKALNEAVKSLAVLMSEQTHTGSTVALAVADIDELSSSVLILQQWRLQHEAWAEREHERISTYVTGGGAVLPRARYVPH